MLRTTTNILSCLGATELKCGQSIFGLEFVRWRRKPRWLPVAKSKLFRVPERKPQPPDEKAELMRLHNIYKTQMRSVRQYLCQEAKRISATTTADHIVLTPEEEETQFQQCLAINDQWNKEINEIRNARLEIERQQRAAYIKERIDLAELRREEERERIEAIVRREKEAAQTFITPENIDATIQYALANPVDYNFSIDIEGNMYRGRYTVPSGKGAPTATANDQNQNVQEQKQASN